MYILQTHQFVISALIFFTSPISNRKQGTVDGIMIFRSCADLTADNNNPEGSEYEHQHCLACFQRGTSGKHHR